MQGTYFLVGAIMGITMQQIRQAVLDSPELRAAVEIGNDQLVADTVEVDVPNTAKLTRERLRQVFGFARSSKMIFDAKVKGNGVETEEQYQMSLLIDLLLGEGIDLWSSDSTQVVGFLIQQGILTQPEALQVQSLKIQKAKPSVAEVGLALALWRPDGRIAPIPQDATAEI